MMGLSFKQWLAEVAGTDGGMAPEKEDPTKFPGAWATFDAPGSTALPPTKRTNYKMRKRCKKG